MWGALMAGDFFLFFWGMGSGEFARSLSARITFTICASDTMTIRLRTIESPFPSPYSPNTGIGAARDSGRRRKGGHDKCCGMPGKVWKLSPLFKLDSR